MVLAGLYMVPTVLRTTTEVTTRPRALTRAEPEFLTATGRNMSVKRTTRGPALMAQRIKAPMPMEAGEARPFQKMATPRTASTKPLQRGPPDQCKLQTVARPLELR